jgi:cyclopropane fatty-acyl-phospholipid synthase-like methyltransferase
MDMEFFNRRAKQWHATRRTDFQKLHYLLHRLDLQPGMRVLDAGCGDGVLTHLLSAAVGDDGFVTGVDAAANMLGEARALHPGLRNVHYQRADLESMPFLERYDRIVMLDVLPHLRRPVWAVARMVREALEPEGRMLIAHDAARETVNSLHRDLALPVGMELPAVDLLARQFSEEGLTVLQQRETAELYFVVVAPPRRS